MLCSILEPLREQILNKKAFKWEQQLLFIISLFKGIHHSIKHFFEDCYWGASGDSYLAFKCFCLPDTLSEPSFCSNSLLSLSSAGWQSLPVQAVWPLTSLNRTKNVKTLLINYLITMVRIMFVIRPYLPLCHSIVGRVICSLLFVNINYSSTFFFSLKLLNYTEWTAVICWSSD